MTARISSQSEVATIQRVLVKHARDAFVGRAAIDGQWRGLNYRAAPDFDRAVAEYDEFVRLLSSFGIAIEFLPRDDRVGLDSLYVRDACAVCDRGVVLCAMGKTQRRLEPVVVEAFVHSIGLAVLGSIHPPGTLEGGDVVWLDATTLAVGRGYRTNDEGISQLRALLGQTVEDLITVPLPHWQGPRDVFHLMSVLSPIDRDLALVYSPLLPVPFREWLLRRGYELVEVPDEEFESMAANVLAVGPRRCIMLEGNPSTRRRLESARVDVSVLKGREISRKGAGGPTCLTRPLERLVE